MSDSEIADSEIQRQWTHATDPRNQRPIRRRYETAAIEIVAAIRRDYLPTMDDNDGGQILSWILDLVAIAVITETSEPVAAPQEPT